MAVNIGVNFPTEVEGAHMARTEHEPETGIWGQTP